MGKTVAIIGGGVSGLLSAKAAKEAGLLPTVFEASYQIGGIWSPSSCHVPPTLTTNVSKYVCTFSDFPWETDGSNQQVPLFPSAVQVGQYLKKYAKHFLSDPNCIRIYTKVTQVTFLSDRGQWHVKYETALGGRMDNPLPPRLGEDFFDFLIIASGFFSKAFIPSIPGISNNYCQVYHYSQAEILLSRGLLDLSRKSVVVVGGSLSGVELASTLYRHVLRRVVHITKRPLWILPRLVPEDPSSVCPVFVPIDLALLAKIPQPTHKHDPSKETADSVALATLNSEPLNEKADFMATGNDPLKETADPMATPKTDPPKETADSTSTPFPSVAEVNRQRNATLKRYCGNQSRITANLSVEDDETAFVGISDTYAELVRNGDIEVIRGELVEIVGRTIKINQGQDENGKPIEVRIPHADVVIVFATGFLTQLPFLSDETLEGMDFDEKDLFQPLLLGSGILHPNLPQAAFVGMYRGPYFTTIELQARFAASIFSGALPWPTSDEQLKDIEEERRIRNRFPRAQYPHPNFIESVQFHLNLLKGYERLDSQYAISSKYSSSSEATRILENFHSDVEEMRKGRYIPAAVFRNLGGLWDFTQQLICHSLPGNPVTRDEIAMFSPLLDDGEEGDFRSYAYTESYGVENIETFYYDESSETLFVTKNGVRRPLKFYADKEAGWKASLDSLKTENSSCEFTFPFEGIYFSTFTKTEISSLGISEIKYQRQSSGTTFNEVWSFNVSFWRSKKLKESNNGLFTQ